jgi:hypothetical protein
MDKLDLVKFLLAEIDKEQHPSKARIKSNISKCRQLLLEISKEVAQQNA